MIAYRQSRQQILREEQGDIVVPLMRITQYDLENSNHAVALTFLKGGTADAGETVCRC